MKSIVIACCLFFGSAVLADGKPAPAPAASSAREHLDAEDVQKLNALELALDNARLRHDLVLEQLRNKHGMAAADQFQPVPNGSVEIQRATAAAKKAK